LPCLALPCLALPCLALPCLALPCLALPCLALPYHTLPCQAIPCHAKSYLNKLPDTTLHRLFTRMFISGENSATPQDNCSETSSRLEKEWSEFRARIAQIVQSNFFEWFILFVITISSICLVSRINISK
jgi:hypothetical protein